jgi:hypothetical protein
VYGIVGELLEKLALWKWLTEYRCTVQENAVVGAGRWCVLDVDGDVLGRGGTPEDAIADARRLDRLAVESEADDE